MGTDIHLFVEKKIDGKWKSMDKWTTDHDEDPYVKYQDEFYGGRSYNLFAILADVRNGYGFAGCDTGDGFTPISYPKGLPKDVTSEVKSYSDGYGLDGHSHSWFTLKELEDYDWKGQKTKHRMLIGSEDYMKKWRHGDDDVMGWGGGGPDLISVEELEKLPESEWGGRSVQVEWEETYEQSACNFYTDTMPKLRELAKDVGPENVRIVFFFDN